MYASVVPTGLCATASPGAGGLVNGALSAPTSFANTSSLFNGASLKPPTKAPALFIPPFFLITANLAALVVPLKTFFCILLALSSSCAKFASSNCSARELLKSLVASLICLAASVCALACAIDLLHCRIDPYL